MTYSKPEVVKLASAVESIQGGKAGLPADSNLVHANTINAYESDE